MNDLILIALFSPIFSLVKATEYLCSVELKIRINFIHKRQLM